MKRVLLMMFALICFGMTANAQSCKISGASDGSTVMVTNDYQDGSKIVVNLENDSNETCANVTVEVVVSYAGSNLKTYTGRGKSCPGSTCKIEIPIQEKYNGNTAYPMKGYTVQKVSGTKCESLSN